MSKRRGNRQGFAARKAFRDALGAVTFQPPWPRFICDVFLHGQAIGSFAHDRYGFVTFDETGRRFGRRKQRQDRAIEAVVARKLDCDRGR